MQYTCQYNSPIGDITLSSDGQYLTGIHFNGLKTISTHPAKTNYKPGTAILEETKRWLDIYFQGKNPDFTPKIKLEGTPFKIAYRTRNEALLYVVNNLPYNKDENGEEIEKNVVIARALDEITNMKILSRIEGDETKVNAKFLEELGKIIQNKLEEISGYSFDKEEAYKSISLAKLEEMKERLKSGYTSFWS